MNKREIDLTQGTQPRDVSTKARIERLRARFDTAQDIRQLRDVLKGILDLLADEL